MLTSAELKRSATWFIYFLEGITVPSFHNFRICVTGFREGRLFCPHPPSPPHLWAALKKPILNRVKNLYNVPLVLLIVIITTIISSISCEGMFLKVSSCSTVILKFLLNKVGSSKIFFRHVLIDLFTSQKTLKNTSKLFSHFCVETLFRVQFFQKISKSLT